MDSFRHFDRTP